MENCPIGPHAATRIFTLALLALVFSLAQTTAEVRTDSAAGSSEYGYARVTYTTGSGVTVSQFRYGNYYYDGDGLPGHQFFNQNAFIDLSPVASHGTADLAHGVVSADAAVGEANQNVNTGNASSKSQVLDTVTFSNSTGQPATITVDWKVEGSLTATPGSTACHADYQTELRLDGPGLTAIFGGSAYLDNNPSHAATSTSATGWETSSVQPFNQGYGGADFSGTVTVPPGGLTFSLSAYVFAEAQGDRPAVSNFGNTTALTFTLPQGVSFTSTDGILSAGSRLANISTRARVVGGDNVSIAGFIVTGNVPKKVIVLGIGPSLAGFVPNPLPNPTLQLNRDNTVLTTNDDWKDSQQTEIQNSGLAPTNNLESAIIRTLDPGSYTAVLSDKNNAAGIGVVQVYDLDTGADAKLANISTRAFIESGDNVLFAGIIGGGNGSQPKVVITGRGPSLVPFGVPNAIPDPFLELHDKNGALIASNNDWQTDQQAAIAATGVAPTNPRESALLVTLVPGDSYTAIVKDATNVSGVALVQVYHLQ
ncbi:MAG TPA: hypothetical protein VJU77_19680 [Chthoniobacterales bacterium]|nr:hypothetical protein [Chthoniobacterales bacterium]